MNDKAPHFEKEKKRNKKRKEKKKKSVDDFQTFKFEGVAQRKNSSL